MRRPSLRRRLMWLVGLPVVVVWLATGAWIASRTLHETDEMFDQELLRTAAGVLAVMPESSNGLAPGGQPRVAPDDGDDDDEGLQAAITLRDANGRLLLHSPEVPSLAFDPGDPHFHSVVYQQRRWRVYQRWDPRHEYWIQVAAPLDERDELLGHLAQAVLVPLLGLVLALPLAIMAGLRLGLAPLRRVSRAIQRDPARTPTLTGDDVPAELEPLTRALDALVASLALALDRERRFTADAAHELRHPLAVLRMELDLAEASPHAAQRRLHLQRAHAGLARMERLVAQLMTLARVDNLAQIEDAVPVALRDIAASVLRDSSERAAERGVDLSLDAQAGGDVLGSAGLLAIAIQNLLDNAVRHARERVAVTLTTGADQRIELIVDDDGAGFPVDELPRLGERFHRPQASPDSGSGLGLSIVRAIAGLHGGDVVLGRSASGGGRAVLRLPQAGAASSR